MSRLNLYYRALKEYRKHTLTDKACVKQRQLIKQSAKGDDLLEMVRNNCIIDTAWVEKIEEGLPYVEKAIAEERQFIKNEGDVIEIEKIRRVSKESVEHLARHSDLITHLPQEGDDIIPDKILMVERLNDYAVYENRFLYMLLCYLRDFIDMRLKKIKELGNMYKADMVMKRDIRTHEGRIVFECTHHEENKKDPFSNFNTETIKVIERIESCQHVITSLLAKPLMVIVSKSPMIKPPISKTNVLKMNTKFKNSVALYEYISSYNGLGYEIQQIKKTYNPFTDVLEDEIAEIINISSFLTYKYGNELEDSLALAYEREEEEKKDQEKEKALQRMADLKARFERGECKVEDYILELENGNKLLLEENKRYAETRDNHNRLTIKYEKLKEETIQLNKKLTETENDLMEKVENLRQLNQRYENDMTIAEQRRVADLEKQEFLFKQKEKEMNLEFERKLSDQQKDFEGKMQRAKEEHDRLYKNLEDKYSELSKELDLLKAQFLAVKKLQGEEIEGDFNNRQEFEQLEKEFMAFYEFFEQRWKEAKHDIREKLLWSKIKNIKKKI